MLQVNQSEANNDIYIPYSIIIIHIPEYSITGPNSAVVSPRPYLGSSRALRPARCSAFLAELFAQLAAAAGLELCGRGAQAPAEDVGMWACLCFCFLQCFPLFGL